MNLKKRLTKTTAALVLLFLGSFIGQSIVYSYGTVATTTEVRKHTQQTRVKRPPVSVLTKPTETPLAQAHVVSLFYQDLYFGAVGADVVRLQDFLRTNGYFNYPASTGNFGPLTHGSVIAFQRANDLRSTGVVDEPTRALINHRLQTRFVISDEKKDQEREYVLGSVSLVLEKLQQTQEAIVEGSVNESATRTTTRKFLDLISQLFGLIR